MGFFKEKINTGPEKIKEVLTKGVSEIAVRENLEKRLASGEKLRVKLGIDPTGPNIHIGRAGVLWKLKENLGRTPKVDLIITPEDSVGPFLICGEAKYFHCSVEGISRNTQTAEGDIKKDFKTLLKIKELGIAENVVFIIFDDYYYLKEPEKCLKIKNLLEKHNKKIKILYHNSRAKLKEV